ncbi:putative mucin/carbohydrate-binding domain-containing protein [Listeria booriae]|uniref:putative mucin/carbohydrate-binding domain-containing protein n=1 Tax=Listeria booriae TaxID=1552123 RepID=UPI0021AD6538|nr:putative mucin/carbohydrate-binding domain-containing protein [Listeria booriae]MCD2208349.1 hypothetical protein [Listeria booriae]
MKGLGNATFATMDFSTKERLLTVNTNRTMPHWYFPERYATVLVQGADGTQKYVKNYWGRKDYVASIDKVNLSLGDYITVVHEEGTGQRLNIQNKDSQKSLANQKIVRYQLVRDGIKVVSESDVPKLEQDPPKITSFVREGDTSIRGKATPGASVEVLVGNSTPAKTVKADDLGEWEVTVSALLKGELVRVKSTYEGEQLASPEYKVIAIPIVQSWLGIGETRINGQASPGATIDVLVNGVKKVTVSADASGSWVATLPALTLDQEVQIRATTETRYADSEKYQVREIIPSITSSVRALKTELSGIAVAGATVDVWVQGVKKATIKANNLGNWTATVPALVENQNVYVRATLAGIYKDSQTYKVDAIPLAITSELTTGERFVSGTASPGSRVSVWVVESGEAVFKATANSQGKWTAFLSPTALQTGRSVRIHAFLGTVYTEGEHVYTVK